MDHDSIAIQYGASRSVFSLDVAGQADAVAEAAQRLAPYVPMKADQVARFLAIFVGGAQRKPGEATIAAMQAILDKEG